jgi:acetyl esterase
MKIRLLIYLTLITATLSAQSEAFETRQSIANGVENLNVSPTAVHRVINKEISGDDFSVKVRLYYPSNQDSLPILYFIHGGGWIGGSLDTHDNISRHLANQTNSIVVAVDYRRSPEYKFPIPLDDCYFILHWIKNNFEELNGNGDLFLVGDSAGANLVLAVLIKNIESNMPVEIKGQILINPATDLRDEAPKYSKTPHNGFINWYVPAEEDRNNPLLSPITYPYIEKLPKAIIVVCEDDKIKQDGVLWHNLMLKNKKSSVIFELKGVGHLGAHGAANSEVAKPAIDFIVNEFNKWMEI